MELEYNLIEKFADPDLMMGMSVADKLKATAVTFSSQWVFRMMEH